MIACFIHFTHTSFSHLTILSAPVLSSLPSCPLILSPVYVNSDAPTLNPAKSPIMGLSPTNSPASCPSYSPTQSPTYSPTSSPTLSPTYSPTQSPTYSPTRSPTLSPTYSPTRTPTYSPTSSPTFNPTQSPTMCPNPTLSPTYSPMQTTTTVNIRPGSTSDGSSKYVNGDFLALLLLVLPISASVYLF